MKDRETGDGSLVPVLLIRQFNFSTTHFSSLFIFVSTQKVYRPAQFRICCFVNFDGKPVSTNEWTLFFIHRLKRYHNCQLSTFHCQLQKGKPQLALSLCQLFFSEETGEPSPCPGEPSPCPPLSPIATFR